MITTAAKMPTKTQIERRLPISFPIHQSFIIAGFGHERFNVYPPEDIHQDLMKDKELLKALISKALDNAYRPLQ